MKYLFVLLAASSMFLSSCGGDDDNRLTLENNEWELETYGFEAEGHTDVLPGSTYSLFFNGEGDYNGKMDCNDFFGRYSIDSGAIIFESTGETLMLCSQSDDYVAEMSFIRNALSHIESYSIIGDSLTTTTSDGAQLTYIYVDTVD